MYDLIVKALTPGQPTVCALANVGVTTASALLQRYLATTPPLADPAESMIVPHVAQRSTDNYSTVNKQNLEVLTGVLNLREQEATP